MNTRTLPATDPTAIAEAAALLRAGELVAFPTETVYGLGANALDPAAVQQIFTAKERPVDNPLIVHVATPQDITALTTKLPPDTEIRKQDLMRAFWPGPLSLVLPKQSVVPAATTAGLKTVVLRCPAHPAAQALLTACGVPIAAPSANRSGRVSPTTAAHVADDLRGRIPLILDGDAVAVGLESTVLDLTSTPPALLRPGTITRGAIERVIGPIADHTTTPSDTPRTPGQKYRHYAPRAPITLVTGSDRLTHARALAATDPHATLIHHSPLPKTADTRRTHALPAAPAAAARELFATLRAADTPETTQLIVEGYATSEATAALMNRLEKAATVIVS